MWQRSLRRAQRELASFKRPKHLLVHGAPLPRSMSNKILKRELRDTYCELPAAAVTLQY